VKITEEDGGLNFDSDDCLYKDDELFYFTDSDARSLNDLLKLDGSANANITAAIET